MNTTTKKILLTVSIFVSSNYAFAQVDFGVAQYAKCIAALSSSKVDGDGVYRQEVDQALKVIKSDLTRYISNKSQGSRILSDRLFDMAEAQLNSEYDFYAQIVNIGGKKSLISEVRIGIQKNCKTLPK
jgi:hypothetical protein